MTMKLRVAFSFALFALAACSDQTTTQASLPNVDAGEDAGDDTTDDAGVDAAPAIDAAVDAAPPPVPPNCTSTFGSALTAQHGRIDGVVRAVVVPGTPKCRSDNDHVIVQVDVVEAAATVTYPVWVNVYSTIAVDDPAVRVAQTTAPLVGPAWASGWHEGVSLDYPSSLGIHSDTGFSAKTKEELGALLTATLPAGTKVSAFMFGFDTHDGGHKVHRNGGGDDGAVVVVGAGTPKWLLFHFSQQTF